MISVMHGEGNEIRFVYWDDDSYWLGYLEEFPDYLTQCESLDELRENLAPVEPRQVRYVFHTERAGPDLPDQADKTINELATLIR